MMEVHFTPFPVLETERLVLRKLADTDAADMFVMRSDKELMQYIPRPVAQTEADALDLIRMMNGHIDSDEMINWGIELKASGRIMGTICFIRMSKENYRSEVGYLLHRDLHGKGYIQEALDAVLAYGFNVMKLHTVSAVIDPGNIASEKLLQRNGFVKEAHFREDCYWNGTFLDSVHYGLLASEYAAR